MLKSAAQYSLVFALLSLTFLTACNKAEDTDSDDVEVQAYVDQALVTVAESASAGAEGCYELVFPLTLTLPDGSSAEIASVEAAREFFRDWRANNPRDPDNRPELVFPIELISAEGEVISLDTQEALRELRAECGDRPRRRRHRGNRECSCFQLVFPLSIQFSDATTVSVADRSELRAAVREWKADNPDATERPELVFPLTIELEDGTTVTVVDREALQAAKEECRDAE
ncbi:MAG: hypothetical protein AAFW73_24045 [Bacteroidota bacterium]